MKTHSKSEIESLLLDFYKEITTKKECYFLYFLDEHVSFELWLTIELAMSLKNRGCEVNLTPRVMVKDDDQYEKGKFLDLFVSNGVEQCVIELKIAIPTTQNKYKKDCQDDIDKLANINNFFVRTKNIDMKKTKKLFILITLSKRDEKAFKDNWNKWLDDVFTNVGDNPNSLIAYSKFANADNEDLTFVAYHKFIHGKHDGL